MSSIESLDVSAEHSVEPIRQRRKEARPAELTAAALALFVEKGFAATRLDDIAVHAGVSKGTLYLYFDSKDALFKAVIQEGVVPVLDAADEFMADFEGSSAELMQNLMLVWWQRVGSTTLGGLPKLMIGESRNFPEVAAYYHEAVIERGRVLIQRVLQRGIDAGEFRPLPVEMAADVLFAPVLMLAIWRHSMDACGIAARDPEAYLKTHLALSLDGLLIEHNLPPTPLASTKKSGTSVKKK